MKTTHEFLTPRNIYEKLLRENDRLEAKVNGDHMFNFLTTAYHLSEWVKNAPIHDTEQGKRLVKKAGKEDCIKLCKQIITAKKTYKIVVDHKELDPEAENEKDIDFYNKDMKEYKFIIEDETLDLFKFKNHVTDIYKPYFQIK